MFEIWIKFLFVLSCRISFKKIFVNRIFKIFIDLKRGVGGGGVMVCCVVNIEVKDVLIIFIEFCKYVYILIYFK